MFVRSDRSPQNPLGLFPAFADFCCCSRSWLKAASKACEKTNDQFSLLPSLRENTSTVICRALELRFKQCSLVYGSEGNVSRTWVIGFTSRDISCLTSACADSFIACKTQIAQMTVILKQTFHQNPFYDTVARIHRKGAQRQFKYKPILYGKVLQI